MAAFDIGKLDEVIHGRVRLGIMAYLASAVERLSHADHQARTDLGAADRPLVQRIAANWLAVVTGAMSELQTRARLSCHAASAAGGFR